MAVQQAPGTDRSSHILEVIKEGMEVYDRHGKRVGTVTDLYFGASSAETEKYGTGSASAPPQDTRGNGLLDDIARAFTPEQFPGEIRKQLLRDGFVKINGEGLFSRAQYVLPGQIDSVAGNRIELRISGDELIKRTNVA